MSNKFISSLFCIATFFTANAQSPNAINYQAVARNNSGTVLANQAISVKISFLDLSPLGTVVYSERHNVSTNTLGLFTLQIGAGSVQSGDFTTINWGTGTKFIKIEMDAAGGTNFTNLGTTQIISVPYSLYSNVAGSANGLSGSATITPSQITNGGATNNQILQWNGSAWTPSDDSNSEWKITGNSGMVDGTNFIGTTDNIALNFRMNNQKAGRVDSTSASTFLGYGSGKNNSGINNSFLGYKAGYMNTSGAYNIALGSQALYSNTIGSFNFASGYQSLFSNTTGDNNIASGFRSLYSNTTGNLNIASGSLALYSNTTGNLNIASGSQALYLNTTGDYNIAAGSGALYFNTTGDNNIASGFETLASNTTGDNNIASGFRSLAYNTTGYSNVAIGYSALFDNKAGSNNIAIGPYSLYNNTASDNVGFGNTSGFYLNTGNYNTRIGINATNSGEASWNNTGMFGYSPLNPGGTNVYRIGNASVSSIGGQTAWTTVSDARIKENIKENIPGLDFINKLRPVSYNYNINKENHIMDPLKPDTAMWEGKYDIEKMRCSGFLAQEVDSIAKSIGYDFSGVDRPKTVGGLYGLRYAEFVVPLVKAVQEQQKTLEEQKAMIDALMKRIEELEKK